MHHDDPWIVTDERLPCLILAGHIEPTSNAGELKEVLETHAPHVSNVYNCAAFALDKACTSLFCIKKDGRVAFVNLRPSHPAISDDIFSEYTKEFQSAVATIRDIINHNANKFSLVLEKVSIAMTGRQPN